MSEERRKPNVLSETLSHRVSKRISAVNSLKEIVVILAALTITNAMLAISNSFKEFNENELFYSIILESAMFIILLLNIVRFYHGNIRILDDTYLYETEYGGQGGINVLDRKARIYIDYIFVFAMSLLFALQSFFTDGFVIYILLFCAILMVDIMWVFLCARVEPPRAVRKTMRNWFFNNIVILILLILLLAVYFNSGVVGVLRSTLIYTVLSVLLLNIVVDFFLNFGFYFPSVDIGPKNE